MTLEIHVLVSSYFDKKGSSGSLSGYLLNLELRYFEYE